MRTTLRLLILCAWLLLAVGCGIPVPPEKSAYVGEWQEKSMVLIITADGSVRYERLKKGATVSVTGPLKSFDGDGFSVGLGPFATKFTVNRPPYQQEGHWKMEVDGVVLTKTRD